MASLGRLTAGMIRRSGRSSTPFPFNIKTSSRVTLRFASVVGFLRVTAVLSSSPSSSSSYTLPPSLTSDPVSALVPPGQCQFGPEPVAVPLLERVAVSPSSYVLRFGLPDRNKPLNLSTCACLLARAQIPGKEDEEVVTRPYTPISTNQDIGSFSLLVKNYGPTGTMSTYLCEQLALEDKASVRFLHIPFNVKTQAPFDAYDHICMLVGGSGITPMMQALHAILGAGDDNEESLSSSTQQQPKRRPIVTLLYGSRSSNDILGLELLQRWASKYPEQLRVVHVLSQEPDDSDWKGLRGYITKELIQEHFPSPAKDNKFQIWVCGPPSMYQALSGPRDKPDSVEGVLAELGYTAQQVYKF